MPVNLPNFLNAPVQKMVPDIFGEILQGYTMAQEPKRLRDEAMARELAMAMARMQNEYYPQIQQQNLDIGDVNLQSGRLNLDALPRQLQDDALLRSMNIDQARATNPLQTMLLNAQIQAQQAATKKSNFQSDPQAQMEYIKNIMNTFGAESQQSNDFGNLTPLQRSIIEKATGLNLKAAPESPEAKKALEIETFKEKERIKAENQRDKDLTEITPTERTRYQSIIREVNSIMPVMKELVDQGGESNTYLGTANDLKYLGKVKRIADVYMKAKGWPNTDTARNDAIALFKRGKLESKSAYKSRMQELQNELIHESSLAENALGSGRVSSTSSSEKDPLGIM